MKKLLALLFTAILLAGCGQDDNSPPYLFKTELERVWHGVNGLNLQVDLSDLNSVVITGLSRDGISSTCTYSTIRTVYNDFYGSLNFTYVSGDTYVCSQFTGVRSYNLVNDTREGKEKLTLDQYRLE